MAAFTVWTDFVKTLAAFPVVFSSVTGAPFFDLAIFRKLSKSIASETPQRLGTALTLNCR